MIILCPICKGTRSRKECLECQGEGRVEISDICEICNDYLNDDGVCPNCQLRTLQQADEYSEYTQYLRDHMQDVEFNRKFTEEE